MTGCGLSERGRSKAPYLPNDLKKAKKTLFMTLMPLGNKTIFIIYLIYRINLPYLRETLFTDYILDFSSTRVA
jgi:hypothetical protein